MNTWKMLLFYFFGLGVAASAQNDAESERWNAYAQATSIGQYHGTFRSPYAGANSLQNYPERDVSLTSTLFLGLRLASNTQFYFNPEIAGGRGFSGVTGVANFPNGEMPRISLATPAFCLARAYFLQDFGFGSEKERVESGPNSLAGERPATRYTVVVGRFAITDFFDNNRYANDPRRQFLGWGVMFNGAWDYPADTRGYTWGWVHEFHTRRWALRYASAAEPKTANGLRFDRRLLRDRADVVEGELHYRPRGHDGAVRLLTFFNHTDSGSFADALRLASQTSTTPDTTAVRRPGTLKYGFALNLEQELTKDAGVFLRLGWNDGKTQPFAFTAIDRMASGGVSISGARWHRKHDTVGAAFTASGLSAIHAEYLSRGGMDFLIGDGALNYAPEYVAETYYNARLFRGFYTTFDLQRIVNPAFNQDRGPVWAASVRLHWELGQNDFRRVKGARL